LPLLIRYSREERLGVVSRAVHTHRTVDERTSPASARSLPPCLSLSLSSVPVDRHLSRSSTPLMRRHVSILFHSGDNALLDGHVRPDSISSESCRNSRSRSGHVRVSRRPLSPTRSSSRRVTHRRVGLSSSRSAELVLSSVVNVVVSLQMLLAAVRTRTRTRERAFPRRHVASFAVRRARSTVFPHSVDNDSVGLSTSSLTCDDFLLLTSCRTVSSTSEEHQQMCVSTRLGRRIDREK
jgi:hypothetical protein